MNNIRLTLMAIIGTLVFSSCAKQTTCKLETLSNLDGILHTYEYDDQLRISRINSFDPLNANMLSSYYLINRNDQGKIISVDHRSWSGIAINYYTVSYNSDGYLGTVSLFTNSELDFVADEYNSNTVFYYGNDVRLDSTVMTFGGFKRSTSLIWTGDNITSISHQFNDVLQYSKTYVYDDLNNAFGDISEANQISGFDIGVPDIQSLSKNNIVQMSHYDAGWNLIGTYDYTFPQASSGNIEVVNGSVFLGYHCE